MTSLKRFLSRGTALPIVLLMSSMLLVTAAAWLEAALVDARVAASLGNRVTAFHAADSALIRCSRIAVGSIPAPTPAPAFAPASDTGPLADEPVRWRLKASFEGGSANAISPFASWPYGIRPPQCLIEPWPFKASGGIGGFLITARGFGRTAAASEAWLQLQVRLTVTGQGVVTHWRRVVARPFQGESP
jgi:Tfp pilus assembly protein PilX